MSAVASITETAMTHGFAAGRQAADGAATAAIRASIHLPCR